MSLLTTELGPDPRKRLLDAVPEYARSSLVAAFVARTCSGAATPEAVVAAVLVDARHRGDALLDVVVRDPEAALGLAHFVLEWEALTQAERARRTAAHAATTIQDWMRTQPPTRKQILELRRLGHAGDRPANRAEADDLICSLQGRGTLP